MSAETDRKDEVQAMLGALQGVRDSDFSKFPDRISIQSDASGSRQLIAAAVGSLLKVKSGLDTEVDVELGAPQSSQPDTRVRFDSLEIDKSEPGRVRVRVLLDWNGLRHEGEASGESGFVGELRASAMATACTLGKVVGDDDAFSIVGVKEIHVFDHDIVAVLLNCPRLPERRLIGLAIVSDDRSRAAALSVLNATNRALGTLSGTGGG